MALPAHPEQFTAAWLSAALQAAGVAGSDEIDGCGVEVIGVERGFTGVVARITLRYREAVEGAPASVIGKFPLAERAGTSSYRELQASSPELAPGYIERSVREVSFYREAGPDLPQVPRCYFGHADPEAGEVVLLLEDLASGEPGDALAGCAVDEARSVLACVAHLHGRWWASPELGSLDWPGDWAGGNQVRVERYRQQAGSVVERYAERLPPGMGSLILALRDRLAGILAALAATPHTLIHLDLHLDNVIFLRPEGDPLAYVLDWQSVSVGPAMLDVAGFIVESLSVDDRRVHERDLLCAYRDDLARLGVSDYPFERLRDDYLRVLLVRLAGTVGWLARAEVDSLQSRERELVEAIFVPGRLFTALDDYRIAERLRDL